MVQTVDGEVTGLPIDYLTNGVVRFSLWAEANDKWVEVHCEISYGLTVVNVEVKEINQIRQELITLVRMMLENQFGVSELREKHGGFVIINCMDSLTANVIANRINGINPDGSSMYSIYDGAKDRLRIAHSAGDKTVKISGFPIPKNWENGNAPDYGQYLFNLVQQRNRLVGQINMLGTLISSTNCVSSEGEMHFECESAKDAKELVRRVQNYSQLRFIQSFLSRS